MTTLNIDTNITHSDVEVDSLITSNTMSSYFFIAANIIAEIEIDGKIHELTLQTGHTYNHGDYSLPSNSLSIYESSAFIEELNTYCESDLEDDETIDYINFIDETNYSKAEMVEIYLALCELINEAGWLVNEAEFEADESLENDSRTYVLITEKERVETYEDNYKIRQCAENYSKSFNTKQEAEDFIRNIDENPNNYDYARIVDKEIGITNIRKY